MSQQLLKDKTALVTGASSGIGLGCAISLAQGGATVVIMGRRQEVLEGAKAKILQQAPGAKVEIFTGDACDEQQVKDALSFTRGLNGRLDILVPAVGGPVFMPLLMRETESVRDEIDMNFTSTFLAVRHGVPLMEKGGSIVCISSTSANQAWWGLSIYASMKAAVDRFVKAAALELGSAGIRINAVRPGPTIDKENADKPGFASRMAYFASETPLGRIGFTDDIGPVVRFLASDEAGWVTGQSFSVDGGQDQCTAPNPMEKMFGKEVMDLVRSGCSVSPESKG